MAELNKLPIKESQIGLIKGDFSAAELTESYLDEIKKKNGELNACLEVFDDALSAAEASDSKRSKGEAIGPLEGIPLIIKDNILIEGKIASAASKILSNYRASYDATVVKKLREAGAIFLGRANMDEFAMGSSGENSAFGPAKNPHDVTRVPGGSSSGTATALAAGLAAGGLGSDTAGSIRQPASFCGVVGMKPSYGAVSRSGLIALTSSMDQIGPLARTVEDAELLFKVIRGVDPLDSTTVEFPISTESKTKFAIGVPEDFLSAGLQPAVAKNFAEQIEKIKQAGWVVKNIDLPSLKYTLPVYYVITPAEVSANLARIDGLRYGQHEEGKNLLEDYLLTRGRGFGPETRRRIILGTYVLSAGYHDAYYNKAVEVRRLITTELNEVLKEVDAILTPTSPTTAFPLGEKASDPLAMYLADIFTAPANLAGLPSISVPSGFDNESLPIGLQFTGRRGGDSELFAVAKSYADL